MFCVRTPLLTAGMHTSGQPILPHAEALVRLWTCCCLWNDDDDNNNDDDDDVDDGADDDDDDDDDV